MTPPITIDPIHPADLLAGLRELDAAATPVPWAASEWYCNDTEGGWAAIGPHHHAETDDIDDGPDGQLHEAAKADAALIAAMRNALPALLDQLDAQAAEIERWRSDWKQIAADEAVWYTLSDIFGVEGMTNAAGVVSGVTEKWNERQARVAELEGLLRPMTNGLRQFAANGIMDEAHEAWRIQAEHFCQLADAALDKREGGR